MHTLAMRFWLPIVGAECANSEGREMDEGNREESEERCREAKIQDVCKESEEYDQQQPGMTERGSLKAAGSGVRQWWPQASLFTPS